MSRSGVTVTKSQSQAQQKAPDSENMSCTCISVLTVRSPESQAPACLTFMGLAVLSTLCQSLVRT